MKFKAPIGRPATLKSDYKYSKCGKFKENGETLGSEKPWEMTHVKYLGVPRKKLNLNKEKVFDTKNDGKPAKIKKETKSEGLRKAYMKNDMGKIYHHLE